jgi:hypothetical protein
VRLEENNNAEQPKPKIPEVTPPKVDIRPEIQNLVDEFASKILPNMTVHELQYFVQKTGLIPASAQTPKKVPAVAPPPKKRTVEPLPELREFQEIMDGIEAYVTEGFEEPKAIIPLRQEGAENPLLNLIMDKLGSFLDNIGKNPKVQDGIANFLDALAKKMMEGK